MILSIKAVKEQYGKAKARLYLQYLYTLYMYSEQDYEHFSYYIVLLLNKFGFENGVETLNHFVKNFISQVMFWGNDVDPLFEELRKKHGKYYIERTGNKSGVPESYDASRFSKYLRELAIEVFFYFKPVNRYKMKERIYIDGFISTTDDADYSFFGGERLLAEDQYRQFYSFSWITILINRDEPNKYLFFGENKDLSCIYKGYLVQADRHCREHAPLLLKNIITGDVQECPHWFAPVTTTNGHFMKADYINDIFVDQEGSLRIYVGRFIGDFRNEDLEKKYLKNTYYLIIKVEAGKFTVSKVLLGDNVNEEIKNESNTDNEPDENTFQR